MLTLYHHPLSPFCRKVRLLLSETGIEFTLQFEKPWERRPEFLALSPFGEVPLLVEGETNISDTNAICEYLHELHGRPNFLGETPKERAWVRSLSGFFDRVFYQDAVFPLLGEKALRRLQGNGTPDAPTIRRGYAALEEYLKYIGWLAEQNKWLASDQLSLADLAAASQLSVIDYLGDVPWDAHNEARNWYARIKSRPSFRPLLADTIPGLPPGPHYANLDF